MTKNKKGILIMANLLLVGACIAALTTDFERSSREKQRQFTGKEAHRVSLEEARTLVRNFRVGISPDAVIGGFFGKDAILAMLARPDVVGIRAYFAQAADGSPALVLVGVNKQGEDIVEEPGPLDRWFPCPPFCPTDSELLRGHYASENKIDDPLQ